MLLVDLEMPKTCKDCPMSCRGFAPEHGIYFDDVICRTDYNKHEPMDDGCPIKGKLDQADCK